MSVLNERLKDSLARSRATGTYKELRRVTRAMGPTTTLAGKGEVLVFCSNDYLGLAAHPLVVQAAREGLERYGAGTASVRFICGTFECHYALEAKAAEFLGAEAALSYSSCWNANEGLLPALVEPGDAVVSDETNHASIIDAGRLSRGTRKVFHHRDLASLRETLDEIDDAPVKLIVTDGVFSMEGDLAPLPDLVALARERGATVVVDDSHGTGVLGATGRGTLEHFGLTMGRGGVDIVTSTFGKALGGGNGGFVAGSRDLIEHLIQRSRPHLFSNALAPPTACAALRALEILEEEPDRVTRLRDNVAKMRGGLGNLGFDALDSASAIIPIIVGDTAKAIGLSDRLLELGVFVIGFGFPVVPEGTARLRVQMSAAHTDAHIERALDAFSTLQAVS